MPLLLVVGGAVCFVEMVVRAAAEGVVAAAPGVLLGGLPLRQRAVYSDITDPGRVSSRQYDDAHLLHSIEYTR